MFNDDIYSSFTGNSQSPLQQEIETYLKIDDSHFNLMFSARAISSMVCPFMLPLLLDKIGTKYTTLLFVFAAGAGQYIFILGLEHRSYLWCVASRFVFGISDMATIMQQVIMCLWFSAEQLPIAYSILLFLTKMARAINDNIASLLYNHFKDLETFFWIGGVVCIFSMMCAIMLMEIHTRYIDKQQIKSREQQAKQTKPKIKIRASKSDGTKGGYPREIWFMVAISSLGFAVVHSFYPNMSKFLQQNYGMSNVHAGHLSSIPYMVGSVSVPIFGQVLAYFGEAHYEKFGKCYQM